MSISTMPAARTTPSITPAPPPTLPGLYSFTVDQYDRMTEVGILTEDDRVELINGCVVTKMAKGPGHVRTVQLAGDSLEPFLLGGHLCLRREAPARIPPLNEPEPDLAIARGAPDTYDERHPEAAEIALVAEVSDTTYRYDRYVKLPTYAKASIPVYWIVSLGDRQVEVYSRPLKRGDYRTQKVYKPGERVPVMIDGHCIGEVAVNDILPRAPATPAAGSNGD
jgi:Uma2 family endonuclease